MSERPQATTIVQPWMPGMPKPEGMTVLDAVGGCVAGLPDPYCPECRYLLAVHADPFSCPTEAEARSAFGDR